MKKILGIFVAFIVIYIGVCFSLGYVAENSMKEQIDFHNKNTGQLNGFKMELVEYSHGILSSNMDVKIKFTGLSPAFEKIYIESRTKIQHGPLLWLNNSSIGAYATQSTIVIHTMDEEVSKKIHSIFGDSIGLVRANVGFAKTYKGDWTIDAIDITQNTARIKIDKSAIEFSGDLKNPLMPNVKSQINIGTINIKDESVELVISPWSGTLDQHFVEEGVPIANMNLTANKITIQNSVGVPISLENMSIEQKQNVTDKKMDTMVVVRLEKFDGPIQAKNSYYQIEFNHLAIDGLKNLYKAMNNAESPEQQLANLMPALTDLLTEGIQLKASLGSELMDGKFKADLDVVYHAPADGKNVMEMKSPDQILALISADLLMTVSESIANQTPLGGQLQPLVGSYVTLENGEYQLKANLKDTTVTIGTQTIPAEQYMPLLMMGAMGMMASSHQEMPSEENPPTDEEVPTEEMESEKE